MSPSEVSGATHQFDVVFECTARNSGRMRTEMTVRMVQPEKAEYQLASDEGTFHGGDGTAPPPLTYFAAGLASCLMTQLRAFSKRLRIDVAEIVIDTRCHWIGEQEGRAPYVTQPKAFTLDIAMQTQASLADQVRLLEAGKKGCFIEQTLCRENAVGHRLKTAEGWLDV